MKKVLIIFIAFIVFITIISPFVYSQSPQGVTKHPTLSGDKTEGDIPLAVAGGHIYHIAGNLTIQKKIPGNQTGVIFVDGNLTIGPMPSNTLSHGNENSGLVFVVKGDVNIDKDVTEADAVIISEGSICTATQSGDCPLASILTKQLVVNGGLISLNASNPIKFRRSLGESDLLKDSTDPAEKINHQVKYLVILRDLLSDTYQKWSEIP